MPDSPPRQPPPPPDSLPGHATLAALDWLATPAALLHTDGRLHFANGALESLLGQSRQQLHGQQLTGWLDDGPAWQQALHQTSTGHYALLRHQTHVLRLGQEPLPVCVIMSLAALDAAPGAGRHSPWILVEWQVLDAPMRHHRDSQLLAQSVAQKVQLRSLAHEIRNPLGGVRGAAQLLELQLAPDSALREYTRLIVRETDRLRTLLDRLLLPHHRTVRQQPVNIHEVLEQVRALVQAECGPQLHIVRDYDTSIPELSGDRGQILQAVLNVVRNAAQALAVSPYPAIQAEHTAGNILYPIGYPAAMPPPHSHPAHPASWPETNTGTAPPAPPDRPAGRGAHHQSAGANADSGTGSGAGTGGAGPGAAPHGGWRPPSGWRPCITLRTRVAHQITLGRQRHRLVLELAVHDNGPGIDPHLQDSIFLPLVSGHAQGSGLGLALAQAYVQQHQGLIACDSRPGDTTFFIRLPLGAAQA